MKYIAKFKSKESITNFIDTESFVNVDKVLEELTILVFEIEKDFESEIDRIRNLDEIIFFEEDRVLKLDVEDTLEQKTISGFDIDASSTYMGDLDGSPEYTTHLELLNSVSYSTPETLNSYETTSTGAGVRVYVLDTGVNSNNYYVKDKLVNTDSSTEDDSGHGTYCALLIAGEKYGVARDAQIVPIKVLDSNNGGSLVDILGGINSVIADYTQLNEQENKQIPFIMNLSLGISPTAEFPKVERDKTNSNNQHDNLYLDSIKQASVKGIHVVCAAGNGFNSGNTILGPMESIYSNGALNVTGISKGDNVNSDNGQGTPIVVGSVNSRSQYLESDPTQMSGFSNYGSGNTIQSIGGNLVLPNWMTSDITGSINVNFKNGTSFSAPIVSGLLALYLEKNKDASPTLVKHWLKETATLGGIKNIMSAIEIDTTNTEFTWTQNTSILKLNATQPLYNNLDVNMKVQIHAPFDTTDNQFGGLFVRDYLKSISISTTMWWEVIENVEVDGNNVISFKPTEEIPASVLDTLVDKTASAECRYTINILSNESNSHELKDGVVKWQKLNSDNRLEMVESTGSTSNSDEFFAITNLGQTPNLCAFNPYQPYKIDWKNINKLDLKTFYDQSSPLNNVTIKTLRNEIASETKYKVESGDLPTGVTFEEDGKFQIDSETYQYDADATFVVEITAFNDYSEFTRTMEIVDTHNQEVTPEPDPDLLDFDNFVWYNCDNENIMLDESGDFKKIIFVKDDKCIVWSSAMPAEKLPTELKELIHSNLYYAKPKFSSLNLTNKKMSPSGKSYVMKSC